MDPQDELRETVERSLPRGRPRAAHAVDDGVDALLHLAGIDDGAPAAAEGPACEGARPDPPGRG